MTMLMPMAIRPIMELCTKILEILVQVKKFLFTDAAMMTSRIKERTKLYSEMIFFPTSFTLIFALGMFFNLQICASRIIHYILFR